MLTRASYSLPPSLTLQLKLSSQQWFFKASNPGSIFQGSAGKETKYFNIYCDAALPLLIWWHLGGKGNVCHYSQLLLRFDPGAEKSSLFWRRTVLRVLCVGAVRLKGYGAHTHVTSNRCRWRMLWWKSSSRSFSTTSFLFFLSKIQFLPQHQSDRNWSGRQVYCIRQTPVSWRCVTAGEIRIGSDEREQLHRNHGNEIFFVCMCGLTLNTGAAWYCESMAAMQLWCTFFPFG